MDLTLEEVKRAAKREDFRAGVQMRLLMPRLSVRVTRWVVTHTRLAPNQITLVSFLVGLGAAASFASVGPLARAARAAGGDGARPDGVPHLHRRRRRPRRRDLLPARGAGQLARPRPLGLRAPDADRGRGSLPLRVPPRRHPAPTTAPLRGIAGMSTNIGSRTASTARPPRGTAGAAGRVSAIVLAAGSGSRFTGSFIPKQFVQLM